MFKCRSWRSSCRVLSTNLCRHNFAARGAGAVLLVLILMLCLSPGDARAQMMQLNDDTLRGITGQSGVSINTDGVFKLHYDVFKISDTQATRNWIELYNVNVGDGAGGGFSFATSLLRPDPTALTAAYASYIATPNPVPVGLSGGFIANNPTTWTLADFAILDALNDPFIDPAIAVYQEARMPDPITIDVATKDVADSSSIPVGTTFIRLRNTSSINPRWISVGSFVFNASSTNITNSAYLSNTVGHYLTAHTLTNAQLVANLGLNDLFDYLDPTTWAAGDVTLLVATLDPGLATLASAYAAVPADFHLQTQPLGSIALDGLREGPSVYRYWAPTVGQGIRFDYTTTISADALTYAYNTTATGVLKLSKINIAGLATGDPSDPYDTNSSGDPWAFSGNFKIGTIDTANTPATMDVGTDSSNVTSLSLSLPMAGSIRVAEVNFGGNNFGPIAIDGIQFHRLDIKLTP